MEKCKELEPKERSDKEGKVAPFLGEKGLGLPADITYFTMFFKLQLLRPRPPC